MKTGWTGLAGRRGWGLPVGILWLILCGWTAPPLQADELESFANAVWVPVDWADGDSFRVRFRDGREFTLRLYGVDCLEARLLDDGDARRLRAQRRYFGISGAGGSPTVSIALAKSLGQAAGEVTASLLAKPFTVHTAFADGRGDARYQRIYAFVTTADGTDLGAELVRRGLARAYGVARSTPDGRTQDEYREALRDLELVAARAGRGIWEHTDWDALPGERSMERSEEAEVQLALRGAPPEGPIDVNRASRDELMSLPGIGEVLALSIIQNRPYKDVADLGRVRGIGPKTLDELRPYVRVAP